MSVTSREKINIRGEREMIMRNQKIRGGGKRTEMGEENKDDKKMGREGERV